MGMYLTTEMEEEMTALSKVRWENRGIRYLGVNISTDLDYYLQENIKPLLGKIKGKLLNWDRLSLSWFGQIAMIEMKILPQVFFLLQNLLINVPKTELAQIQSLLNRFIWSVKKARVRERKLYQPYGKGGLVVPNILIYYNASRLVAML